jgi:uncharacterized protein (TIGR03083 family)
VSDQTTTDLDLAEEIEDEFLTLAALLESASPDVWDAPSLCAGWRTREVVAHMTMPARYSVPQFMAKLEAAGGDFTSMSDAVAAEDGALPPSTLLENLRSEVLHAWEPPGGGAQGALTHAVIHGLDCTEADTGIERNLPGHRMVQVLSGLVGPGVQNPFGVDLTGVELRADDVAWSHGSGALVSGPAQVLALVACGRTVPPGRLRGQGAERFTLE